MNIVVGSPVTDSHAQVAASAAGARFGFLVIADRRNLGYITVVFLQSGAEPRTKAGAAFKLRARHARLAVWVKLWPFLVLLVLWEIAGRISLLPDSIIPPPTVIVLTTARLLGEGTLPRDAIASLGRICAGFTIAAFVGLLLAVTTSVSSTMRHAVGPIIELCRPISPIAWIPFAIVWFNQPSVFIVFIAAVFPIYLNAVFGLTNVPPLALLAARSMQATRTQTIRHVIVPAAMPAIMSGLRLGLGFAWTSVIAAELVAVQNGLGYEIQLSRLSLQPGIAISLMVVVGLLGLIMSATFNLLERFLVPWAFQHDSRS